MSTLTNIDVAILCGGLGKRLRSEIGETQKAMAKIDEHPFLDILLQDLSRQGFKRVILCTGYQAQLLEDYYRHKDMGLIFEFSRESEPLGTGGAIKLVQGKVQSDSFLVLNGDCYSKVDYKKFLSFHESHKALISMVVSQMEDTKDFGTITLDDMHKVMDFKEKINSEGIKYVNAGIYCFGKNIFALMPKEEKFSLEMDLFPKLTGGEFYGFEIRGSFIDIGTPERYKKAQQDLKKPR